MKQFSFPIIISMVLALILLCGLSCFAQRAADNSSPMFGQKKREGRVMPIEEAFERRRVEREQKEFRQMIERGDDLLRISGQIERSFEATGSLSEREHSQLADVEKLAKQIRSKLGGDDDGSTYVNGSTVAPLTLESIRSFREASADLVDEIKKTTRFSISAGAIEAANVVVRLSRSLRQQK